MEEQRPGEGGWADAVSEAAEHVHERADARDEAAERLKPKAQGPRLAAASIMLLAVVVWDVQLWMAPPEAIARATEEAHLVWFVADAVDAVEDFRAEQGRLPTAAEMALVLDSDVVYSAQGERYSVSLVGETSELTYDGSIPFEQWAALYAQPEPADAEGAS